MDTQPEQWSQSQVKEYENCDKQHIEGMLYAENKTKKLKTTPWSPIFQNAISEKAFWKIALSLKMNHIYPSVDYLKWAEAKGIQDFKGLDITEVKINLRKAQKAVREVTKQAAQLREIHLQSMLTEAEINDEKQQKRRLKILLRAHNQQQIFKRLRNMFNPSSSGGLSYILVPNILFVPLAYVIVAPLTLCLYMSNNNALSWFHCAGESPAPCPFPYTGLSSEWA
jgi:hypothetical protein